MVVLFEELLVCVGCCVVCGEELVIEVCGIWNVVVCGYCCDWLVGVDEVVVCMCEL